MASDSGVPTSLPCVTQQSSDFLKLKISISGHRGSNSDEKDGFSNVKFTVTSANESRETRPVPREVTSKNLYLVLTEIHNLIVRRDPRGIFANPVTDDIAVGYSQTISHPMDLGTISARLRSRTHYSSTAEYLADVTLMCNNAMVYNPPDTIYYQRARKLLAFCRKQFVPAALQKLWTNLNITGLTESEIGELNLPESTRWDCQRSRRYSGQEVGLRSSTRLTPPSEPRQQIWSPSPRTTTALSPSSVGRSSDSTTASQSVTPIRLTKRRLSGTPEIADEVKPNPPHLKAEDPSEPTSLSSSHNGVQLTVLPPRRPRGRPRKIRRGGRPPMRLEQSSPAEDHALHSSVVSSPSLCPTGTVQKNSASSNSSFRKDSPPIPDTPSNFSDRRVISTKPEEDSPATSLDVDIKVKPSHDTPSPCSTSGDSPVAPKFTRSYRKTSSSDRSVSSSLVSPPPTTRKRGMCSTHSIKPKFGRFVKRSGETPGRRSKIKRTPPTKNSPAVVLTKTPDYESHPELTADEQSVLCKSPEVAPDEPVNELLVQARQAASAAALRLSAKYAHCTSSSDIAHRQPIGPHVVYLDCSIPGEVSAVECPHSRSTLSENLNAASEHLLKCEEQNERKTFVKAVHYPPVLTHMLTGSEPHQTADEDVICVDPAPAKPTTDSKSRAANLPYLHPFTPDEAEVIKGLTKLKYNTDEPISAGIHGPLTIFSASELAQFADVYGNDPSVIEYAYSLLKFVEPVGRWARRWATKKLDAATDGMHSQLATLSHETTQGNVPSHGLNSASHSPSQSSMTLFGLTIDPPTPPASPKVETVDPVVHRQTDSPFTPLLQGLDEVQMTSISHTDTDTASNPPGYSAISHVSTLQENATSTSEPISTIHPHETDSVTPATVHSSHPLTPPPRQTGAMTSSESNSSIQTSISEPASRSADVPEHPTKLHPGSESKELTRISSEILIMQQSVQEVSSDSGDSGTICSTLANEQRTADGVKEVPKHVGSHNGSTTSLLKSALSAAIPCPLNSHERMVGGTVNTPPVGSLITDTQCPAKAGSRPESLLQHSPQLPVTAPDRVRSLSEPNKPPSEPSSTAESDRFLGQGRLELKSHLTSLLCTSKDGTDSDIKVGSLDSVKPMELSSVVENHPSNSSDALESLCLGEPVLKDNGNSEKESAKPQQPVAGNRSLLISTSLVFSSEARNELGAVDGSLSVGHLLSDIRSAPPAVELPLSQVTSPDLAVSMTNCSDTNFIPTEASNPSVDSSAVVTTGTNSFPDKEIPHSEPTTAHLPSLTTVCPPIALTLCADVSSSQAAISELSSELHTELTSNMDVSHPQPFTPGMQDSAATESKGKINTDADIVPAATAGLSVLVTCSQLGECASSSRQDSPSQGVKSKTFDTTSLNPIGKVSDPHVNKDVNQPPDVNVGCPDMITATIDSLRTDSVSPNVEVSLSRVSSSEVLATAAVSSQADPSSISIVVSHPQMIYTEQPLAMTPNSYLNLNSSPPADGLQQFIMTASSSSQEFNSSTLEASSMQVVSCHAPVYVNRSPPMNLACSIMVTSVSDDVDLDLNSPVRKETYSPCLTPPPPS
ncbi:unnamed protein product [Calicophoron daubneyi]|uniref:Bromo domain-containing protein n=1 Tax=Calicophoron daubneyi TaxID=300641 RepID=A0AAV2TRF4_CALDB